MRVRPAVLILLAAVAAVLVTSGCSRASGSFEQTLKVGAAPHVTIHCPEGSVIVRGGGAGTITVSASFTVRAPDAGSLAEQWEHHPPIEQHGDDVVIGAGASSSNLFRKLTFHYQIELPSDAEVTSDVGVGHQNISGLQGKLHINTGVGRIELADFSGDGEIKTGVGDLDASHFSGKLRFHTGTGSVHVHAAQAANGSIDVETGVGSVEVENLNGSFRAHTGTGKVTVSGAPLSPWNIDTGAGSVELMFSPKAALQLKAESPAGEVRINNPEMQGQTDRRGRRASL